MPGHVVIFQEGPGGTDDEPAAVARIQNVALVHVPPAKHVSDVGEAHGVRVHAEATRLMIHRTLET